MKRLCVGICDRQISSNIEVTNMEGHVRGVQNKSKATRERKDFLVNVFRANLNCFLLSLGVIFSPPAPPSCHVIRCLFISANR